MHEATTIEFITVSTNTATVRRLEQSIRATLGTPPGTPESGGQDRQWRLTVVDGARHDLFTGYNAAAHQTSGDILVFLHDDVVLLGNALAFESLLRAIADPRTGVVGVMGSTRLNQQGCWWGDVPHTEVVRQCRGLVGVGADNPFGMNYDGWPGGVAMFGRVLVIDGAFLACHRRTFEQLGGFDAQTFKGFHFYDIDFTFRAHLRGLINYAAPFPLFHNSRGNYDAAWEAARDLFVTKFKEHLPARIQS